MKVVAAAVAYMACLAITAAVAFFSVLLIAGPHAGLLASWLEPVVLAIGWLAVLVVPVLVARAVWRRNCRSDVVNKSLEGPQS